VRLEINLNWKTIIKACEFDENIDFLTNNQGIYLWLFSGGVPLAKNRVIYIGETSDNFANRHIEHFKNTISGIYTIFNLTAEDDFKDFLVKHWHNKTISDFKEESKISYPNIWDFSAGNISENFLDEKVIHERINFIRKIEFAFATVEKNGLEKISFKEIEAALICGIRKVYTTPDGDEVRMVNEKNCNNRCEAPIGPISKYPTSDFKILHCGDSNVKSKLPKELLQITGYKK